MRLAFILIFLLAFLVALNGCIPVVSDYTPQVPSITVVTPSSTAKLGLKAPEIASLAVNKSALSVRGLDLAVQAQILNPNSVDLELDQVKLTILNTRGENQSLKTAPGGSVKSASVKTFDFDLTLSPQSLAERDMTIKIETKTANSSPEFPLSSTTKINIPDILNPLILKPQMNFQTKIIGIHQDGTLFEIETRIEGSISNPNPLDLRCNQILIFLRSSNGTSLAQTSLPGGPIGPNSTLPFKSTFLMPISVLNTPDFTASVEAATDFNYYNYTVKSSSAIAVPKLKDVIIVPKMTLTAESEWLQNQATPVRKATITASIPNENNFNLAVGDYQYNLTKPDGTSLYYYTMSSSQIMGIPMNSTRTIIDWPTFGTDVIGFASQDTIIAANVKIGLPGVNEQIPLAANMIFKLKPRQ